MSRQRIVLVLLLVAASLLSPNVVAKAQTNTIQFASDTTWTVADGAGTELGTAQNVCLNPFEPITCPSGATLYGYAGGWVADLSNISTATWIWAPGITAATFPAFPGVFSFSKSFTLSGMPTAGTIAVAADDFAEVFVNGVLVGTIGSTIDESLAGLAQSSLTTFDITSFLVSGTNVIVVRTANGTFGCGAGEYGCNPAGVVFGGSLQYQPAALEVGIDIKPGDLPNSINPRSKGVIPVAILSTASFDATTVDSNTILFGKTGYETAPVHFALEDVDRDGDLDMILHFNTRNTGILCGDTSASLKGKTVNEQAIAGSDAVSTVGCR